METDSNPTTCFPQAYKWGGSKHLELLDRRQTLLTLKFGGGPFGEDEWIELQSIRGLLDAIEEERGIDDDRT
jgi:hypothetical protein